MDTDAVLYATIGASLIILAVFGSLFLTMDFRHYNEIHNQCKEQGFIQNETTRITCKVE